MNKTAARWCFIVWLVVGFLTIRLNAQPPATADPVGPSHLKRLTNVFLYADRGIDVGDWGIAFDPTDTVPTTPLKGNIYYDLSEDAFKYYNGSAWKVIVADKSHDLLTGLTPDDDHTQYLELDGSDTMTGPLHLSDGDWIGTTDTDVGHILFITPGPVSQTQLKDALVKVGDLGDSAGDTHLAAEGDLVAQGSIEAQVGFVAYGRVGGADPQMEFILHDHTNGWKIVNDSRTFKIQDILAVGGETKLSIDSSGNIATGGPLSLGGLLDLGAVDEFDESDETPNVSGGSYFKTHATTDTITNFDDGGDSTTLKDGQIITVFSKGAITFDSSTHLRSGSANLVTANGDLTVWMYDGADWVLLSFMDDSINSSLSAYVLKAGDTMTGSLAADGGLEVDGVLDLGTVQTFADGDGTPDVSGGAYFNTHTSVEVITDFDGSGIVDGQVITVFSKGDTTFDTDGGALQAGTKDLKTYTYDVTVWMYNGSEWVLISFMDDTENANPSDSLRLAQRHVDFTGAGTETMITAESKFGFITVDTAKTINLVAPSGLVVGMTVTILVTADVVVTIDGNGSNVWMDGTTDSSDPEDIVNSGSAGECISLFWDGTAWRAHHVEGSWTI